MTYGLRHPLALLTLLLPCLALADYGPRFVVEAEAPVRLESASQKVSYRFTCTHPGMLRTAAVYCAGAGRPLLTRLALYADSAGNPAGQALRVGEFVPAPAAWSTLDLSGAFLEEGRVYHLVLQGDLLRSGAEAEDLASPGGSSHLAEGALAGRWSSFAATVPLNRLSVDGKADPASQTLLFDGKHWRETGLQPAFVLRTADGVSQGNPYARPLTLALAGGSRGVHQAEVLHFSCEFSSQAMQARLRKKGSPDRPLRYRVLENLYHEHRQLEVARGEISAASLGGDWKWVMVPLDLQGRNFLTECYYISFDTDAGAAEGSGTCKDCYELSAMEAPAGLQDGAEATFDGGAHRSRASVSGVSGGWDDRFEADANVVVVGNACPPWESVKPLLPVLAPPEISAGWPGDRP